MSNDKPSAALRTIMRMAEEAKVDCPSDPESPDAIRNGRFASIALVAAQGLGIVNGPPLEKEPSAEAVAYSITLEGKHVGNIHERKERADFERCALENLYPHHKRTVVALYPPEALQAAEERARKAESDALELSSKVENLNSKWGELKGIIERAKEQGRREAEQHFSNLLKKAKEFFTCDCGVPCDCWSADGAITWLERKLRAESTQPAKEKEE